MDGLSTQRNLTWTLLNNSSIWNSMNMTVQLPLKRRKKILDELGKIKKRIYKKKCTPVKTLVK
jgi:hypothetical protein